MVHPCHILNGCFDTQIKLKVKKVKKEWQGLRIHVPYSYWLLPLHLVMIFPNKKTKESPQKKHNVLHCAGCHILNGCFFTLCIIFPNYRIKEGPKKNDVLQLCRVMNGCLVPRTRDESPWPHENPPKIVQEKNN